MILNKNNIVSHKIDPLLEVKNFSLTFEQYKYGLRKTTLQVIRKLDMVIREGEIVAVIGASGSGKSLLADAILGILPDNAHIKGRLKYKGHPLTKEKQMKLRGNEISLIPQSVNALDPLVKTDKQVQSIVKKANKKVVQQEAFQKLGLPLNVGRKYPFELSGGMVRKVLISISMLSKANLIIADEPTPGLDPEALNDIVKHLKQLACDGKGVMFITHDLDTALKIADRVVVMNKGEVVDTTYVESFTRNGEKLNHPYTRALWNSLPQNKFNIGFNYGQSFDVQFHGQPNEALEIRRIKFYYRNGPVLFENVNFTLNPGEVLGLFGYSGSGKTTMAKVISGYLQPKEGSIIVNGDYIIKKRMHPIQLIWQHPESAINPKWKMMNVIAESQVNDEELHILGIKKEWLTRYPSELSGGELQRICIARAFHKNTKYIIADEMTTMLDSVTQANIWQAVLHLIKKRKIGLIAISHNYHLLQRISNRVINFNELSNLQS